MSPNFLCWQKPLPPISSTDEERQLRLALALSKEEHEKVPVPRSPGRSSLLALGLLSGAPEPKTPPCSGACFTFCALGCLLSALPAGSAPGQPSARVLALLGMRWQLRCWVCLLRRCWLQGCSAHGPRPLSLQEVRAWQGENSLLQRAVEETAPGKEEEEEEDKMKKSQVQHWGPGWSHSQRWAPGLPSPLYSLSVRSPLSWSWRIYSGRRQPPAARRLPTRGICQVGATRGLPKLGTVAETSPLPSGPPQSPRAQQ